MLIHAAETRFQRGLMAQEDGRELEALALFEAALELERRLGAKPPQARYLSHYGLALARDAGQVHEGTELCRQAVALEFFNADLFWNYGRVLMLSDRRKEAYAAFVRGLCVQKNHQAIIGELARMGWRKRPVIRFLARSHPINAALGRLLRPSRQAVPAGRRA